VTFRQLFESCPARDQAVITQLNEVTDHVTLMRTADGGRFDGSMRWVADNMGTRADFRELWPTLKEMIETWPAGWRSHLLVFNWDHDGQPERPPMAFSWKATCSIPCMRHGTTLPRTSAT
jgi:hypothetical protein